MTISDRPLVAVLLLSACAGLTALPAGAAEPNWNEMDVSKTVNVLTSDEDGDIRETRIWMSVVEGTPYIRTSRRSRWGDNVERNPEIALRVAGNEYPLRAQFIEDEVERDRIVAVFEQKYGSNPILNWIRGDAPRIMRLDPR